MNQCWPDSLTHICGIRGGVLKCWGWCLSIKLLPKKSWDKTFIDQKIYLKIVSKFRGDNCSYQLSVVSKKLYAYFHTFQHPCLLFLFPLTCILCRTGRHCLISNKSVHVQLLFICISLVLSICLAQSNPGMFVKMILLWARKLYLTEALLAWFTWDWSMDK